MPNSQIIGTNGGNLSASNQNTSATAALQVGLGTSSTAASTKQPVFKLGPSNAAAADSVASGGASSHLKR